MDYIDPFSLQGKLLVATPDMADPRFKHSVIFICEHDEEAAMGLVINREKPGLFLSDILKHDRADANPLRQDQIILAGGPVGTNQGFVLHAPFTKEATSHLNLNSHRLAPDLYFSTDRRTLKGLARPERPTRALVCVGYAGWESGQLDQEILDNFWMVVDGTSDLIFDPDLIGKWDKALLSLGILSEQIAPQSGSA